jgi:hypothetical protein
MTACDATTAHTHLDVNGIACTLTPPSWGAWLRVLDSASSADGEHVDAERLLRRWLHGALRHRDSNRPLSGDELAALSAHAADTCVAAGSDMLAAQAAELAIRTEGNQLHCSWGRAVIAPWTLGQRATAMRQCLHLTAGEPSIDLAAYELAEAATCCQWNCPVPPPSAWPVPLGEAVAGMLEQLNEPQAEEPELMARCHEFGIPHPDLDRAALCLQFGWSPEAVDALDAAQAQRLLAAGRLLAACHHALPPACPAAPHAASNNDAGLTRIVVRDA